jgi:hypothetical protein
MSKKRNNQNNTRRFDNQTTVVTLKNITSHRMEIIGQFSAERVGCPLAAVRIKFFFLRPKQQQQQMLFCLNALLFFNFFTWAIDAGRNKKFPTKK